MAVAVNSNFKFSQNWHLWNYSVASVLIRKIQNAELSHHGGRSRFPPWSHEKSHLMFSPAGENFDWLVVQWKTAAYHGGGGHSTEEISQVSDPKWWELSMQAFSGIKAYRGTMGTHLWNYSVSTWTNKSKHWRPTIYFIFFYFQVLLQVNYDFLDYPKW